MFPLSSNDIAKRSGGPLIRFISVFNKGSPIIFSLRDDKTFGVHNSRRGGGEPYVLIKDKLEGCATHILINK